jgi:hypothetical protein
MLATLFIYVLSFLNVTCTYVTVAKYLCGRKWLSFAANNIFVQRMSEPVMPVYTLILNRLKAIKIMKQSLSYKANSRSTSKESVRVFCGNQETVLFSKTSKLALGPIRFLIQ